MFIGKHDRSLDDKGRLVLPSAFRHEVEEAGGGVLAKWDRCLALWTRAKFMNVMEQLIEKVKSGEASDDTARLFQADAVPVSLDGQGRFHVNDELRRYAGIGRDVLVVGQTNRVELWEPVRFAGMKETKSDEEVSQEMRALKVF